MGGFYKVVMVAINKEDDIVMAYDMTLENAKELLEYYKEHDYRHCYEIKEM